MILELIIGAVGGHFLVKKLTGPTKSPVNITPKDLYNTKELSNWDKLTTYQRWRMPHHIDRIKKQAIKAKQRGDTSFYIRGLTLLEDKVVKEILESQGFIFKRSYYGGPIIDLYDISYKEYHENSTQNSPSLYSTAISHALARYRSSMGSR